MSLRTERVASAIREELASLFSREYRDPAYGFMTVTEVHMTSDLRLAKIYVSVMGNGEMKERTLKMLENQRGAIRSFLGAHVRLKFTPSVQFYIDQTLDRVEKINNLIKQIHRADQ